MVKHVVLLRFKPETSAGTMAGLLVALHELRLQIPGLLDVSAGTNSSPEGLAKGFTHGFVMTFADEASRDGYLPHPAHEAVKAKILPWVNDVLVVDWM